ncbi:hypothetical protein [Streptomyces wuyuanensis]|uniref:hypothetical protein n=1 Tax=Streptomyces wuyuanensis TaxID=1196353 RepID=UPI0037120706
MLPHQGEDLLLKFLGLQGLNALDCGSHGSHRHPVLEVLGRAVAELTSAGDLGGALEPPQLGAELVRRRDDQGLELVDRGGGSEDCTVMGGKQHPPCLAFATEGPDQMLGAQGIRGGPDGVEHVSLAAPVGCSFGAAELDDPSAAMAALHHPQPPPLQPHRTTWAAPALAVA